MRKLSWGKVLAVCLSVVMVLSLIPNGRIFAAGEKEKTQKETSSVVDASTLNVQVDFYDYSITKYKNKPVDETAKIALNAYQLEKFASENTVSGSAVFLFGGDRTTDQTGPQNVWTTRYHKSLYQGIVEKQLDPNGNLVFNNKNNVYSVNIFPQEGDNTLEDAGVVETYYNTNFQFLNEDGTYQFDSTKHAAYGLGKGGDGELKIDFTKPGPHFSKGVGTKANEYGFFPFNAADDTKHEASPDERHCMFGMKMDLPFFMPENGKVALESGPDQKKDMAFEFSGDDDVWIFVDGNLVLDLGGIHDATGGKINFATGDVTYDCNSNAIGGKNTSVENIYKAYKIDKTAFSEHTLTMFYLERGEYDSNCKITFNIPTLVTNEDISIKKKVENAPKNNTDTYDFELLYGTGEKKLDQTYKGPYQVHDSTNALVGERKAENGRITLKAGETAVIDKDKIGYNQYYKVREVDYSNSDNYLTPSWIATRESGTDSDSAKEEKTSQSGTGNKTTVLKRNFQNSSGSHIEFTNHYKTSKLSLKKMVEWKDKDSDKNASFDFIVTIGTDTYDVSLKDGETKEFEKIPVGTEYTITEVITAGAIYTAPDTMTTEVVTPGSVKVTTSGALNGKKSESEPGAYLYQVTGKTGTEDGAVSMVVYTNHEKETATPTPKVTTSPGVTNTPGKTNPPGATNTPGKTNPPGATNTPGKTNPPEVTNTPNKTEPPKVTGIPDKTEPPKETGTPDQTATPKVTDTPQTEIPETKIPNTEVPKTEELETTPVVIDTPGVPLNPPVTDTETSSGETTLPEETNPPTGITTPPEKTKEPTRYIPDDTDLPGDPAGVNLKNHTDEDDEGETGDTKETEKTEEQEDKKRVIVEDDVPGTLPKTGGMGIFETEKGFVFGWMLLLPIFLVAGSIYLVVRKKNKR